MPLGGLLSYNSGGLLNPEEQQYLRSQGLLGLAGQLLSASGPSTTPTSFGQALGKGFLGAQQGQQDIMQGLLQNKLAKTKLDEAEAEKKRREQLAGLIGSPGQTYVPGAGQGMLKDMPGTGLLGALDSGDPNAMRNFYAQAAGIDPDMGIKGLMSMSPSGEAPASVREWEFYNNLSPEDQAKFLGMKRQMFGVKDIGNVPHLVANAPGIAPTPLSTLGREAEGRATVEGAKGYGTAVSKGAAEADVKQHESAISAGENIAKIDTLLNHLKSSDAITGMGAELLKNVERTKVFLTDSEKAGRKVSDTELLDVMMGSEVFPLIGALGVGARGLDTPAEREFMRQVLTGSLPMNKQTLIRMTEIRRDIAQRAIDKFNKRVDSGELDKYFNLTGRQKQKIDMPGKSDNDPLGLRQHVRQ